MAIWLRAREEFADNRFQLLFMYRDTDTLAVLHVSVGFALVWPARPSQQAPRGEEGKGRRLLGTV